MDLELRVISDLRRVVKSSWHKRFKFQTIRSNWNGNELNPASQITPKYLALRGINLHTICSVDKYSVVCFLELFTS